MKSEPFFKSSFCQPKRHGGFSLIEMLMVLSVIAILSSLMMPTFNGIGQARSLEKAGADISSILEGARAYAMAQNTYVWVGFAPSPAAPDQLVIGVVASNNGAASPEPDDLVPISRTKSYPNIQLQALDSGTANNRPLPAGQLADGNSDTLTFTIQRPETVTFDTAVIQFNQRGEMRISQNLVKTLEIGLQESVGGQVRNPSNYAAIQIQGLSGAVSLYRP